MVNDVPMRGRGQSGGQGVQSVAPALPHHDIDRNARCRERNKPALTPRAPRLQSSMPRVPGVAQPVERKARPSSEGRVFSCPNASSMALATQVERRQAPSVDGSVDVKNRCGISTYILVYTVYTSFIKKSGIWNRGYMRGEMFHEILKMFSV